MIGFPNETMARKVTECYQLKVVLKDIRPMVWRRVHVPVDIHLDDLHLVLQAAFSWTNSHLHSFNFDDQVYSTSYEPGDLTELNMLDDRGIPLSSLVNTPGQTFSYTYDFGDDWHHIVTLEKQLTGDSFRKYPLCSEGMRAAPPEDCGGPPGFAQLRRIMKNPAHPEYQSYYEWIGYPYFPDLCDIACFDRRLSKLRKEAKLQRSL
jgi:hypothetical protein